MLLDVSDPVLDVVEALLVGDVVHQHDAHGAPVVGGGDGPTSLTFAAGRSESAVDLRRLDCSGWGAGGGGAPSTSIPLDAGPAEAAAPGRASVELPASTPAPPLP